MNIKSSHTTIFVQSGAVIGCVQYYIIFHKALQWLGHYLNQNFSYGVSDMRIFKNIDPVIMALYLNDSSVRSIKPITYVSFENIIHWLDSVKWMQWSKW